MKQRICSAALALAMLFSSCLAAQAADGVVLSPSGLYAASDGTLIIADGYQRAIWQRTADGNLTRLAGREGVRGLDGAPLGGYRDGAASEAAFATPWAIAPYLDGWAVTDPGNHAVRYLGGENVSTAAGTGTAGSADGLGTKAAFDGPMGLAAGPDGCLFVADTGNNAIRKLDAKGNVTTVLGASAGLLEPAGLCYADGVLYVADAGNHRICKLENGVVSVVAGGKESGERDGPATQARFSQPQGLAVRDGVIYVTDTGNGAVRMVQNGMVSTLMAVGSGTGGLYPVSPRGLALVGDTLHVGDTFARTIFSVPTGTGFHDVPTEAWFAAAVDAVSQAGLMTGVAHQTFAPNQPLERSMCAITLSRLAQADEQPASAHFADVPENAYYAKAAAWAVKAQIMPADGARFHPAQPVTRAELAAFLMRCAKTTGHPTDIDAAAAHPAFSDMAAVPEGMEYALRWAYSAQILLGKPGNLLGPNEPVSRAEAAVMLARYLDWNAAQTA